MTVDTDFLSPGRFYAVTERGDFTVHTHASGFNNGFDFMA